MSYIAAMQGAGTSRVYLDGNGNVDILSGGTRAARNFNPGNITYGSFAKSNGAIGRDKDGFAIFPDKDTGTRAQESLLSSSTYQKLSIDDAIARYAPPKDNDTAAYQSAIENALGLPGSTPMNSLSADQFGAMISAMQQHENYSGASVRNLLNIGDPLDQYRIDFDPNDPAPADDQGNGVGTGQRGEISSPTPASFTALAGGEKTYKISDDGVDLVGQNLHINANNININLESNDLANVSGVGDGIHLQADSNETIGITGQGLTVTGDAGNDVVNLNADTAATVSGGGYVGLCGNGATLKTDADQAFTINTAPNVTNDTIYADNSTINLAPGWSGSIYGLGLTINMSPDSGSDVTVYGFDDQVTGSRGDTLQADAYDPNDTSDPYAPYEPGDPEPGTPFDPGDFDPFDPLDPYDDERVATTSTKSPPAAPSATAAHDIPSMQAGASATLASDAPSAIDSSSHIATQVSQLVSAMAAFGGSSAGITNLTTATSTANTTLTADPSQATHAFRHAA